MRMASIDFAAVQRSGEQRESYGSGRPRNNGTHGCFAVVVRQSNSINESEVRARQWGLFSCRPSRRLDGERGSWSVERRVRTEYRDVLALTSFM